MNIFMEIGYVSSELLNIVNKKDSLLSANGPF